MVRGFTNFRGDEKIFMPNFTDRADFMRRISIHLMPLLSNNPLPMPIYLFVNDYLFYGLGQKFKQYGKQYKEAKTNIHEGKHHGEFFIHIFKALIDRFKALVY